VSGESPISGALEQPGKGGPDAALEAAPAHVAIIMDGNGRWARDRGLPRSQGHRAGVENVRRVVRCMAGHGVEYLTVFAFSTENWERPDEEVGALIALMGEAIRQETEPLHREGVRIRHIGRLDRLPDGLQKAIHRSVELTKDNRRMTLSIAYDYGGRGEIIDAVRAIMADGLAPSEITEEVFRRYLYTFELPDPDLVIRTAGEMRMSNFLLWQAAYAEYYATDAHWPDFDEAQVARALAAYGGRRRRYGRVGAAE
jgi:undecaprenyl diphosphate synthase